MSGLIFSFEKRFMIFAMTTPPAVPTQNAQHRAGDGGLDGLSAGGGTGRGGVFLRTGPLPSCGSCQKLQLMVISRFFHWNHGLVKRWAKGTRDAF